LLEVADLALDYPDFHARYTLTVPVGAMCGLIGPSGGGKTTLLHAIAGFERPTSGTLRFVGRGLIPLKPAERPLSMLFQEHNLFPHLTAFQNVALGVDPRLKLNDAGRESVDGALSRVGLSGLGKRLPSELSGGQRQRVSIARALVRKRPLMLLDEPFGGLDPGLRREMIALVDEIRLAEGLTVLVSIHTPEDIADTADLMAFIDDGRVLAVGSPAELLRRGKHPAIDRYVGR
jgi:thiamine transport system ATP-binding protein